MISELSLAGTQAGITACFFKYFGEIVAYGDLDSQDIWIMSVCLFVAVSSTLMQLYYLNQAIARYQ